MKRSRVLTWISLLVVGLFAFSPGLVFASCMQMPCDGTVQLQACSVAAGVGMTWGNGDLTYNGKDYQFRIDGLSVGSVGIKNATALGKVYNLTNVADFAGNYVAVAAGMTVGGGGGSRIMRNENGVIIELTSTNQGVDFTLGPQGVKVTLG